MNHISAINAAIKAKSPVVAIPMPGHAPLCINQKNLKLGLKGVMIVNVEVTQNEDHVTITEPHKPWQGANWYGWNDKPEGPILETRTHGGFALQITGKAGEYGQIKTRVRLATIPRYQALQQISKWAEKERERINKKILLGALSPEFKRAAKRSALADEDSATIPVMCDDPGKGKTERRGLPVSVPELPTLTFAAVKFGESSNDNVTWSITEVTSGLRGGSGKTAELALLDIRTRCRKSSPEQLAAIVAKVESASMEVTA